ncbi:MAG: hypothetical protein U0U67_09615 [Chitinophagales bacterium]
MKQLKNYIIFLSGLFLFGCSKEINHAVSTELYCNTDSAKATCLSPVQTPDYYIEQGIKYFRTMETAVPDSVQPNYSDLVVRWEWPPWLLLTGYKRDFLIASDILLKLNPTSYDTLDCRFFNKQPFCRCHVVFNYSGEPCPIYEEFTFNDQGEITFIEAWSDFPSLIPMDKEDYWAEADNVKRLSTKVPGLGNATGKINPAASWMKEPAKTDKDLADLLRRIKDPVNTYIQQLITHYTELSNGCFVPAGDEYPYHHP